MKNNTKDLAISAADYKKILGEIQLSIQQTQGSIIQTITRKKVEMAWQIGKIIDQSLPQNNAEQYGKKLVEQLERDTLISKKVLYKMHSFYKTYPKLPKDDPNLNWSHYRVLSGIKKAEERKYLEDLTRENSWSSDDLQQAAIDVKASSDQNSKPLRKLTKKKISPARGQLFTYKITKIIGSEKYFFDCGFKIFREVEEMMPRDSKQDGAIAFVTKKDQEYVVKKSTTPVQKIHTYKAYLKRVVDGDTLHANIDLGFGIFHEEIIRLAKINASEGKSSDGKKATEALTEILNQQPFFILKSIKTDIFNRYVADIFLPRNDQETDLQKIADDGIYLNQLLLDQGLVQIF